MAAGAPIIAFGKAGILDTVNCITSNSENPTGIIYKDQSQDSLKDCVQYFEDKQIWNKFSNVNINNWAQKFGVETFQHKFNIYIDQSLAEFKKS
jgi:glycogen synthase